MGKILYYQFLLCDFNNLHNNDNLLMICNPILLKLYIDCNVTQCIFYGQFSSFFSIFLIFLPSLKIQCLQLINIILALFFMCRDLKPGMFHDTIWIVTSYFNMRFLKWNLSNRWTPFYWFFISNQHASNFLGKWWKYIEIIFANFFKL